MVFAKKLTTLVAATLLASAPAIAATSNGEYAIKDAGKADCNAFLAARKTGGEEYGRYAGWFMGYISAYNQVIPQTYDIAPWQEVDLLMALMENFCQKNGSERYQAAAAGLISVIKPLRLEAKSEAVLAQHNGVTVQVYRDVMRQLQTRLQSDGLYTSTVDGLYGPGTRKAILAFQQRLGLPGSGIPDQMTLYRALMPTP